MQIKKLGTMFKSYTNETKIFLIAFCLYTFFSFYKLGNTIFNVDAQHWYLRSQNFTNAVIKGKFDNTFQDPKPGVTLMWLTGTNLELFDTLYNALFGFKPLYNSFETFPKRDFAAKAPIIVVHLAFIIFFYYVLLKLTNDKISLIASVFLMSQPYYLGVIRFLHVDGLLTIFMTSATLALFLFFYLKSTPIGYLILSGVLSGLALLTKTQAIFLLPFTITIFVLHSLINKNKASLYVKHFIIWMFVGSITFFLLFPAMWVKPWQIVQKIYQESSHVVTEGNTSIQSGLFYFGTLYRTFDLITLLFGIAGLIVAIIKLRAMSKVDRFLYIGTIVYIVFYFIQMSLVKQKVDRYILPLFPLVSILCGYAFYILTSNYKVRKELIWVTTAYLGLQMVYYMPHFETKGINSYESNIYGSLYNEVGHYLNSKPNSKDLKIMAMTKFYSLEPFVKGQVYNHENDTQNKDTPDYLVTNDFWIKKYGRPKNTELCIVEKSIYFHNRLFWDIYNCAK